MCSARPPVSHSLSRVPYAYSRPLLTLFSLELLWSLAYAVARYNALRLLYMLCCLQLLSGHGDKRRKDAST